MSQPGITGRTQASNNPFARLGSKVLTRPTLRESKKDIKPTAGTEGFSGI
jgi:hypothetical protein